MPFATNKDLPNRIKNSVPSENGRDIMRNVINSQLEAGKSESVAFGAEWSILVIHENVQQMVQQCINETGGE